MKEKKTLLLFSTKKSKLDMQIFRTLPLTYPLFIKPYTKNLILNYQKLLTSNNSNMFIHKLDDKLIMGRSFNNEIIDFLQFEIIEWSTNIKKYETGAKHILLTNFDSDRFRNLFVDLFGFKGDKISVEAIKYLLKVKSDTELNDVIATDNKEQPEDEAEEYNDDIVDVKDKKIVFEMTIDSLDSSETHLLSKIRLEKFWFCRAKTFKNAVRFETEKKEKNVFTNEMGDVVGKIHIEKQELREINIKKPRKVKNKE